MISAIPGIPQDVTAYIVTPSSGDDCIIVVSWKPPSNINMTLLRHYMVESLSGNFTTTKPAIAVALVNNHCQPELLMNTSIRIHAIDYCDRNGASSDNVITKLLEVARNSTGSVTIHSTQTEPTTQRELSGTYHVYFARLFHLPLTPG